MRRTKIVCTIGPASEKPAVLRRLIRAGMNVARLNFSHGTHENHKQLFNTIRAASRAVGRPVAILQDLQGPRIRLGELPKEGVEVKRGANVWFTYSTSPSPSPRRRGVIQSSIPIAYPLYRFVKKGDTLLVDDGKLSFRVKRVQGKIIETRVVDGGLLKSHKGVNTPGVAITAPALTAKDKKDLVFGLGLGVDFVTLSFVKRAADLKKLRTLIKKHCRHGAPRIVAKLERSEAIEHLNAIVAAADAVMIGRGDLALETPPEDVPLSQKRIIEACLTAQKPVIVATQMLESMTTNPRPTRAEVSDVANAVIDHTDATMLSGETASGRYPVEAATMMRKIIAETEQSHYDDVVPSPISFGNASALEHRARAVYNLAQSGGVAAIIIADGALLPPLVALRPETPIFFYTSSLIELRQTILFWNVQPLYARQLPGTDAEWRSFLTASPDVPHARVVLATKKSMSVT